MRLLLSGVTLATGLALPAFATAQQQPSDRLSHFWWGGILQKVVTSREDGGFRLYGPQETLDLRMGLTNEAGEVTIFLPREPFRYFGFSLTKDDAALSVLPTLNSEITKTRDPERHDADADDLYGLEPSSSVQFLVGLRRQDGQPFGAGLYRLKVETTIVQELRLPNGLPWSGIAGRVMDLGFRIAEIKGTDDMKKQLLLDGSYYVRRGQPLEALETFRRLVESDPDDFGSYAPLGFAYLRLNRFREAIDAFEKSLRAGMSGRTTIPYSLAYAYVAEGEEQKAYEVLRGVLPEARIKDELQRYKAKIAETR